MITLAWGLGCALSAATPTDRPVLGKIEWTRLITHSPYWNRHAERDHNLMTYLSQNTPLTVEPRIEYTSPLSLPSLCRYPFIYAHDLTSLPPEESLNLAEFIQRGGFLFVDYCGNASINPRPEVFLAAQATVLRRHLPELRVAVVPRSHEVYSIYFKMAHFPPQTRPGDNSHLDGPINPLQALYMGERMVAIVALNGFQCAWSGVGTPENAQECMQMVANIYIYAMTR